MALSSHLRDTGFVTGTSPPPRPPFENNEYKRKTFPLPETLLAEQLHVPCSEPSAPCSGWGRGQQGHETLQPCPHGATSSLGTSRGGLGITAGRQGQPALWRSLGKAGCWVLRPQSKADCSTGKF